MQQLYKIILDSNIKNSIYRDALKEIIKYMHGFYIFDTEIFNQLQTTPIKDIINTNGWYRLEIATQKEVNQMNFNEYKNIILWYMLLKKYMK